MDKKSKTIIVMAAVLIISAAIEFFFLPMPETAEQAGVKSGHIIVAVIASYIGYTGW